MKDSRLKLKDLPDLPQRQDSTHDQLLDLQYVAIRLGMYDAASVLHEMNEEVQRKIAQRR